MKPLEIMADNYAATVRLQDRELVTLAYKCGFREARIQLMLELDKMVDKIIAWDDVVSE